MSAYRVLLPNVGRAQLACLVALYVTQPATPTLIAVTCEKSISQINSALVNLWEHGLMTREKGTKKGGGRRPWVYGLTADGCDLAGYLSQANECLQRSYRPLGPERDRANNTNRTPISD